jgi:hypothetical protein
MRIGSLKFQTSEKAAAPNPPLAKLSDEIKRVVDEAPHPPRFLFPEAMVIRVDDKVVGQPALAQERKSAPEGAYTNLLFWCNNLPKAPSWALANHIYSMGALPQKLFLGISEKSEGDVSIGDMHKLIHALQAGVSPSVVSEQQNLLVVLDPKHALPVLIRMMWPKTRIVGVFSRPPRVDRRYLSEFDCIVACPSIMQSFSEVVDLPLVLAASSLDQVAAHLRAYFQTSTLPRDHFYYSMRGKTYADSPILRDGGLDLIFVGSCLFSDDTIGFDTFSDYLSSVIASCDDILLHSKWLYNLETILIKEQWTEITGRLLKLGARTASLGKDSLPCM